MFIPLPEVLHRMSRPFEKAGQPLYAVGGIVRNTLLSLPLSDLDVCGPMPAEDVVRLFAQNAQFHVVLRAAGFGTVEIHDKETGVMAEYTTFRFDSYRTGHRPDSVQFTDDIDTDARRRDFTVNALYADAKDGRVIDPTGGLADLAAHRLRAVREAEQVMREDGQRILRMVRFAAQLGFALDEELYRAAKTFAVRLTELTPERLWEEFVKILCSDSRYPQIPDGKARLSRALHQLADLGADRVLTPHSRWQIEACTKSKADVALRLAFLLTADVDSQPANEKSKAVSSESKAPNADLSAKTEDNAALSETDPANAIRADLTNLRCDRNTMQRVLRFSACLLAEDAVHLTALGREDAALLAASNEAAAALYETLTRTNAPFSLQEMAWTGQDVMQATGKKGKEVGAILQNAFLHCLQHPQDNNRETLLALCNAGHFSAS